MTETGRILRRTASVLFTLLLSFCAVNMANAATQLTEIKLASEEWEDSTNKDGSGLYWDIMRLVYEPVGIKVEHSITSYARSVALAKQGKADAWMGSYIDEEENILYPKWHFDADVVSALYRKDAGIEWQGAQSLAGKNVGWIKGYDYYDYIENVKFRNKEFRDRRKALDLLKKGRLDVFLEAQVELENELEKGYLNPTDFEMKTLMNLNLYPAFANTERGMELKKIYDQRFDELMKSGEIQKLYDKWDWGAFPADIQ